MENKKQYIAPELTVVTFKAERGFALSGPTGYKETGLLDMFLLDHEADYSDQAQENWNEHGDFFTW